MTDFVKKFEVVAGVDEVGRGALCGPVVAAAVILGENITRRHGLWRYVRDSKLLSPKRRSVLVRYIRTNAWDFGIGLATHKEIDRLNIHHASLLAMRRAIEKLEVVPRLILVDGKFLPLEGGGKVGGIEQQAIVNGDEKILAIAAASIVAKVYRDNLMKKFAQKFPQYGFERHKGYATEFHRKKLRQHGPCAIHRMTFAPVKGIMSRREE